MSKAPDTRDYFAEMYVAGVLADAGWQIYFPRRDVGFDFIAIHEQEGAPLIRPVQVKGKYPTKNKKNKKTYGFLGALTQVHQEMVLAIPYFSHEYSKAPDCVAYMPRGQIRDSTKNRFSVSPAQFINGSAVPRRDYSKFFDEQGVSLLLSAGFSSAEIG